MMQHTFGVEMFHPFRVGVKEFVSDPGAMLSGYNLADFQSAVLFLHMLIFESNFINRFNPWRNI